MSFLDRGSTRLLEKETDACICNAITIKSTVTTSVGVGSATREALARREMDVIDVDVSEFVKGGGDCQCLVLRLL
ncbi:hypothetical protein COOONC_18207 [Cooperia oncophora]